MIRWCERPSLIMVCDITVVVGEFPSSKRSFFNADTLRNTVRACVAELRIDFLPPVHSPLRGLHTVANDKHGSSRSSDTARKSSLVRYRICDVKPQHKSSSMVVMRRRAVQ